MRFASFEWEGRPGFGVVSGDRIGDLTGDAGTLREALARYGVDGLRERAARPGRTIPTAQVRWLPPITDPDKILCVGLNYFEHAKEAKMAVPEHPSLFVRFPGAQVGHGQAVVRPRASPRFDYEAELAVIVGKPGRHITEASAMDHVAGYSCFAENSVRDWQTHSRQATPCVRHQRPTATSRA